MSSLTIAAIVFACTFGGALLGILLRRILPDSHLGDDSKDVVKMGTGLVATLAALVLGLLTASAKSSFDTQRNGLQLLSTNVILLDRSLKFYGPETNQVRDLLRRTVALVLDHRWPGEGSKAVSLDAPDISANAGAIFVGIAELSPHTDEQKLMQSQALGITTDLGRTRWLLSHGDESSIPAAFLGLLIFWLTVLFISFGLFSPGNSTIVTVLFVCAISLAGALFMIAELDRPVSGLVQISSQPLRDAYLQLGR